MYLLRYDFWLAAVVVVALASSVAIVKVIVEAVSSYKRARLELEQPYLAQMVADLEEIKARLDQIETDRHHAS